VEIRISAIPLILLSCVFFILPLNIIGLSILQHKVNQLHRAEAARSESEQAEKIPVPCGGRT
jgi:hypothetical protein